MRIGCHLSISKGFAALVRRGKELGADVVQYFPKNPRSYRVRVFDAALMAKDSAAVADLGLDTVAHSPYVTNLSTPDPQLWETSVASIVNDLEIATAYGSPYLVVHCGKHVGKGEDQGQALMVEAVDQVLARYSGPVQLLLENTAGQGTELGRTTDELLALHGRIAQRERVGVCFDTCHAFAAGLLDFDRWDEVAAELGREEFRKLVRLVHLNDCKAPFNQRVDRHALLGEGQIGADNLAKFLQAGVFGAVPVVIETPVAEEEEYAGEIARARNWAG